MASPRFLSELLNESKQRRAELTVENERRKKEAVESVRKATTTAMDSININVATIWHNQQQLEAEARRLHQNSQHFAKQAGQWVHAFNSFSQSLKALGDVENWARTIESDMAFINSSLEQIQCNQASMSEPEDSRGDE
eukprot:CAMPEP_0119317688 /NCGR_PEP_ID=MMETSP1333-20130426/43874_1 /TAXON_ID=418940 /ORGANISM="Scyphosphaera apsteinii, Strain RCC1455" /LENGTH=137 /DNA_ID=CAMNT_0007323691 /DNA_START=12 /DNA_END=425 /DNA_ORIENTATION=-